VPWFHNRFKEAMRIAIVSDIHGNLAAFDAVLADLRQTAPDLVFHGGDLADNGASPVEIVDRVRDLGWQGVIGNTDEMLALPATLEQFAQRSPQLESLWAAIREMASVSREMLGVERLAWLRNLPGSQLHEAFALVHASPQNRWQAPNSEASHSELESVYGKLGKPVVVYAHIHRSYIRRLPGPQVLVANTGSVSLSYDGDPRASYLLLDDRTLTIRRVEYDVSREIKALSSCGFPHSGWIANILKTAAPQMRAPSGA
jgi:putative phosphoesterase